MLYAPAFLNHNLMGVSYQLSLVNFPSESSSPGIELTLFWVGH